ncbi:tRNA lysidine(34) synthetase TilS [Pseudooceanicola algae]|uniref:tRNA(Ile)-lysidine synthase n=1 Tax=Pseudooceanicola algae TaxID=1537215 RepID=A0A418SID6_9RHOB|nr:tRNA lysidine(34) synthetase TilS [Pseudooceanicola algae]QPM88935.1 tRNA(Ile)-lysidine synthase [Pseudooceanicola algae]
MTDPDALFREIVAGHFLPGPPQDIGVAVSGGGDSLALLHILAEIARTEALGLRVVTVDHGLRPAARDEAEKVGEQARALGLDHDILTWTGWNGEGNLQDQARRARYRLLAEWARLHGLRTVALGHTAEDQAETFLMRLARSAGTDGLSGMAVRRREGSVTFVRPLLDQRRTALRGYLERKGIAWIDDPSNEDDRFERIRIRKALDELSGLGITVSAISETARNIASVRSTLAWYSFSEAQKLVRIEAGDIVMARAGFRMLQPEIARRLLIQALLWVSGAEYAPRRRSLAMALEAVRSGTGMTLHGCHISLDQSDVRITREAGAVAGLTARQGQHWDGRWLLIGPWFDGAGIRALGEDGLAQCPDWRGAGLPFRSLAGYPSIWQGDRLVAAPHAGFGEGWTAKLLRDGDAFFSALLAH